MSGRILTDFVLSQVLTAYADAEDQGRRLTSAEIRAIAGQDGRTAALARKAVVERGLVIVTVQGTSNTSGECRLTAAGWLSLGRQPKARLVRERTCLRCQTGFLSRNPGHRRCNRCSDAVRKEGSSWDF